MQGPPDLSQENIFNWEFGEICNPSPIDYENDQGFKYYKYLKQRYIYEVTNWFQTQQPMHKVNLGDTTIKPIEDYVNGKVPM